MKIIEAINTLKGIAIHRSEMGTESINHIISNTKKRPLGAVSHKRLITDHWVQSDELLNITAKNNLSFKTGGYQANAGGNHKNANDFCADLS